MTDITAIGELLIDLTQVGQNDQKVPVMAANPGGAPANVAVAASRLGANTAFIGKVGNDGFGSFLRQVLRDNQVSDRFLLVDDSVTTMAVVTVAGNGERTFRFVRGADRLLTVGDISQQAVEQTRCFHFGSVSLTAEPARTAALDAVKRAKRAGAVISYDPNYREALWNSTEEAKEWMQMPLELVDVLKISEEELPLLTGTTDLEKGSEILSRKGISLILITLGGEGAFCRHQEAHFILPGVRTKIADTNGAGDTFLGAVLSQLCQREHLLKNLTTQELKHIVSFANRAASITCSHSGAIPAMPSLAELQEVNNA